MALLKCTLCEKSITAVKVLPCLHLMCDSCLEGYLAQNEKPTKIIQCPSCDFKIQITKSGCDDFKTYVCSEERMNGNVVIHGDTTTECKSKERSQKRNQDVNESDVRDRVTNVTINIKPAVALKTVEINNAEVCEDVDEEHTCSLDDSLRNKREYMTELLKDMKTSMNKKELHIEQLDALIKQLLVTKQEAETELEKRADYLGQLIHEKKMKLKNEINNICNAQLEKYRANQEKTQKHSDLFNDAYGFADTVIKSEDDDALLNLHNEISGRLLDLVHSYQSTVEIFSVKLDCPDRGKEELHLGKLFGQFLSGSINCGTAELVSSFDIELSWPSGLITTKMNEFVVVGKTGAFETSGRVMFCDSNGHLKGNHGYPDDTVPFDAVSLQDGSILVSDNHGAITKFSMFGNVLAVWKDKFKGSGKMARTFHNEIVITSSEEQCIYRYDSKGLMLSKFPKEGVPSVFHHPHGIAVDSQDNLIVADYQQNCVLWLDPEGKLLHKYEGTNHVKLRCPSAVCCDPFDNVLVADFTNDCVHLVSGKGEFLGHLLDKDNGMSCPNFLTLDPDGLLFVGQYGGQIQVFRYLSCTRKA